MLHHVAILLARSTSILIDYSVLHCMTTESSLHVIPVSVIVNLLA